MELIGYRDVGQGYVWSAENIATGCYNFVMFRIINLFGFNIVHRLFSECLKLSKHNGLGSSSQQVWRCL